MPLLALLLPLALALPAAAEQVPRRVLLLGDSHLTGPFGSALLRRIGGPGGRRVDVYAACSAAPEWFLPGHSHTSPCGTWFRRAGADDRRAQAAPAITAVLGDDVDLVIIALGTNMADWRAGGVGDLSSAGTLAHHAMMRGAKCVWVGPPPVPGYPSLPFYKGPLNYDQLNEGLRARLGGHCAYVQSTTPYGGADGIHYDRANAELWAEQVYRDATFSAALGALR
jgi:hypothetical protein